MESIILPNILLCIGVPIAFVPITALSFQTLPKSKNADAASLHALFKNVVTAIATSASATFIARESQTFQNYFVGNLSPHNPVYLTKLNAATVKFSHYYSTYTAQHKAMGSMYRQLLTQARLASFYEIFVILALLMVLLIPIIFVLKTKKT